MQIINDRGITVSTGTGRKCTNWQPAVMTLGELYDRLHTPIRGEETLAAYMKMSKTERDNRKDIGGFVGGLLQPRGKGGQRVCHNGVRHGVGKPNGLACAHHAEFKLVAGEGKGGGAVAV